jgi:hypothetical protein
MKSDQSKTKDDDVKKVEHELADLLKESGKVNDEIDKTNKEAAEWMCEVETRVDDSVGKVERVCSELDKLEDEAGNELDKLVLETAEDLTAEEK